MMILLLFQMIVRKVIKKMIMKKEPLISKTMRGVILSLKMIMRKQTEILKMIMQKIPKILAVNDGITHLSQCFFPFISLSLLHIFEIICGII